MRVPITRPWFDEAEKKNIVKPLETGWVVQGPYVAEFERKMAAFVGADYALATSNCTTALHVALLALGIGKGDKVILPSFTFIASANVIEYVGAVPLFCDIDLHTYSIDVKMARRLLEADSKGEIKAIMPVNLFGLCADLPGIMALAGEFGVKVIEDSACGLGGFVQGKHSGTFGHAGCFSFHPRKAITTGEGGMVVTDDPEIARRVNSLRDHGGSKTDRERHLSKGAFALPDYDVLGFNYRMTDLQGAIGSSQMDKLPEILAERGKIAHYYDGDLSETGFLIPPVIPKGYVSGYQAYVALFTGGHDIDDLTVEKIDEISDERNKFMASLEESGVSVRQGTHAVHVQGYYRDKYHIKKDSFIKSYAAEGLTVALPLFCGMSAEEYDYVIRKIREFR
ncbi:MAG: DegT/DnrJ/EryC1/StrS aminotransferase family protein [Synergistaceae bacterium]|jgi:dTDP-4-amino-4,6-dideoxygalactose transaminase|nr:DegT/DnrJ/EryC1/StrS aminotransferase family protein [Synergistaceae bacterium]